MGNSFSNCCNSNINKLDDFFSSTINNLEIKKLTFKEVVSILFNKDHKEKDQLGIVSKKGVSALENAALKISKENFLKIALIHFYKSSDNIYLEAQRILFQNMFESLYLSKHDILLMLLIFVNNNESEKIKHFAELIVESEAVNYVVFKNKLKSYIEFNWVVIPRCFLKTPNSVENNVEILCLENRDDLEYQLKEVFIYDNIMNFIDFILKEFEERHFHNCEDYYNQKKIILTSNEIYSILIKHKYVFNLIDLMKFFKIKYNHEQD